MLRTGWNAVLLGGVEFDTAGVPYQELLRGIRDDARGVVRGAGGAQLLAQFRKCRVAELGLVARGDFARQIFVRLAKTATRAFNSSFARASAAAFDSSSALVC